MSQKASRYQLEADVVIREFIKDMDRIIPEEDEHGNAITLYNSNDVNVWGFEDGYKKQIFQGG